MSSNNVIKALLEYIQAEFRQFADQAKRDKVRRRKVFDLTEMAVAIGLWSQAITPGRPEIVQPQADLHLTNVALGDVLADASSRTSVKFTYKILSKIDSDDEDDDNDTTSSNSSTTVLCSLTAGKLEQTTVDIVLEQDEEYIFEIVGKNTVYLTGNYVDQASVDNPPYGGDSDSDDDSEGAYDLRDISSDVEMDAAELGSDASRFEEVEDEPIPSLKRPREDVVEDEPSKPSKSEKKNKKQKAEDGKAVATGTAEVPPPTEKKSKKEKKQKEQATEEKKAKEGPTEKEISGGIKILDTKIGTGPMAKKGNTILMRYIGKLQNGKVFDKNTKGKPFTFHLGKGEVIKGWDEGIVGMQVGGERKLTLPPNMAYGKKGTDGIPGNSTLIFECKLMEIK